MTDINVLISSAKIQFQLEQPFFACLLANMEWEVTGNDSHITTAATDGKKLYINEEFFKSLTVKNRVFLIAHEILHCAFDHFTRVGSRDPQYWNMAADYAINQILVDDNIGEFIKIGLLDSKYRGMTAEKIYEDLVKKGGKKQNSLDQHIYSEDPSAGKDKGNSSGDSKVITIDDMKKGGGSSEEDSDKDDKGQSKSAKEEMEKAMDDFKGAVIYAAAQAKMVGKLPANIETLIGTLLEPKVNWKQILRKTIQSLFKTDVSWESPRRRMLDRRCMLPNYKYDDTVDICVSIDTSGSITDDMKKEFLSEIYGIVKYYKNFKMKIWCFDTEVSGLQEFDFTNADKIKNYKMTGGGGTDIACNFEFMKQNKITPKEFICFTDGYTHKWGDPRYCPTTWLIHSNNNLKAPFGRVIEYKLD